MGVISFAKNVFSNIRHLGDVDLRSMSSFKNAIANGEIAWAQIWNWNSSGEAVNAETAMRIAAVYTCVQVRSDSVGMLPVNVYKKNGNTKEIASSHPVHRLLHVRPNAWQTPKQFWKLVTQQRDTYGNSYVIIKRAGGRPIQLDIIECPDEVSILETNEPVYYYKGQQYLNSDILHFKAFTFDGKLGMSPVNYHAETIGALKKLRKYSNRSLSDKPPMYGTSPDSKPISPEGAKALKEYWKKEVKDFSDNGNLPILYNGFDLKTIGLSPQEVQYLDQINATKEDIYGIFNVPPMLAQNYRSGSTYSNAEQQQLTYLIFTLNPILCDFEQECNYKLFTEREAGVYSVKFNEKAILRTDTKTQTEHFREMFKIGVYSQNMILDYLDENPIEGGDKHYVEGNNMVPIDMIGKIPLQKQKELKSILNGHFNDVMDILER
jgi:HK97 family phage portal protein